MKMTLGPTRCNDTWAVGTVQWSFIEIDPFDSQKVSNSLRSHSRFFPATKLA